MANISGSKYGFLGGSPGELWEPMTATPDAKKYQADPKEQRDPGPGKVLRVQNVEARNLRCI